MDSRKPSPQRTPSPGEGSGRSPSSGIYPSNPGTSASLTEGRQLASGQPLHQQPQQMQRGHGRPTNTTSSLFDTTVLTSSNSTPSGDASHHNRAMAQLLDSVTSSASSPPSSQTPPQSAGHPTRSNNMKETRTAAAAAAGAEVGAGVWRSPATSARTRSGESNEANLRQHQRRLDSSQQQQRHFEEREMSSARRARRAQTVDDSEFTELLGETPTASRTPPRTQQQHHHPQQQSHGQSSTPVLHHKTRTSSSAQVRHAAAANAAAGSTTHPLHARRAPPPGYDQGNEDSDVGSPTSTNVNDFSSSVMEESSFYSHDDAAQPNTGGSTVFNLNDSSHHSTTSKSNWASPSEVLQLRAMFQEVTARYQREQARLQSELTKAQAECAAYAEERARVQELQKAYTAGLSQWEKAKAQQAQWAEERALQQLQLEKMLVENQRLQLFIAKKQKLHRGTGHGGGATTVYLPTESQERIRAAVQGVTTAAASAAALSAVNARNDSSPAPFLAAYGPSISVMGGTALDASGRPATAPPMATATVTPSEGGLSHVLGDFHFPPAEQHAQQLTPPAAAATPVTTRDQPQGSPYTFVSSESTPPPQPSPLHVAPSPQDGQDQQQHHRKSTLDSGSVKEADHTQLPATAPPTTSTSAAAAAGEIAGSKGIVGAMRDGSCPSTDPSTSYLSLSPTPLHHHGIAPAQPPHVQKRQQRQSSTEGQGEEVEEEREGADDLPHPRDNVVRAVKKKKNTTPAANPRTTTSGNGAEGDTHEEIHEGRRSSSLVTPSPTASAVPTTPTSTTTPSLSKRDQLDSGSGVGGGPFSSLSSSSQSHHHQQNYGGGVPRDGGENGGSSNTTNNNFAGGSTSRPLRSERGGEGEEEEDEEEGTGGAASAEFDPSYARGVNDISSSSGSHRSNFVTAMTMGQLIDAQAQLDADAQLEAQLEILQQQQQHQHPQRAQLGQAEMSSSPLGTSSSLGGGRLTSTTRTLDTPRDGHDRHAGNDTRAAGALRPSVATTTATTTTNGTTATTTTTTPSFLPSTTLTETNRVAGSTTSTSASGSTWSLQYLYHLPRTPAEALQEELRLLKEVRRLSEENESLTARLQHHTALQAMDVDQREQRLVQLTQAGEEARRRAAQWELTSSELQAEVSALTARCAEVCETLENVMASSKAQQLQAQARLAEAEATSRAALVATREETVVRLSGLRRTWADLAKRQQAQEAESAFAQKKLFESDQNERDRLQGVVDGLRDDLHQTRAAYEALQDRQDALESAAAARVAQVENVLVGTHDELARLRHTHQQTMLHLDELEAEVERLRAAAVTREACMHAMEERLRIATEQLASQEAQLVDASTWQARALAAEDELTTQRTFYEKEVAVYKTAACNLQARHHREMEKAVHRYEKLVVRFEALKLRLSAAVTDGACGNVWASSSTAPALDGGRTKAGKKATSNSKSPANTPENSPNTAAAKEKQQSGEEAEAFIVPGNVLSSHRPAKLACDSVQALRTSVETTDRIVKSLNRAASSRT